MGGGSQAELWMQQEGGGRGGEITGNKMVSRVKMGHRGSLRKVRQVLYSENESVCVCVCVSAHAQTCVEAYVGWEELFIMAECWGTAFPPPTPEFTHKITNKCQDTPLTLITDCFIVFTQTFMSRRSPSMPLTCFVTVEKRRSRRTLKSKRKEEH